MGPLAGPVLLLACHSGSLPQGAPLQLHPLPRVRMSWPGTSAAAPPPPMRAIIANCAAHSRARGTACGAAAAARGGVCGTATPLVRGGIGRAHGYLPAAAADSRTAPWLPWCLNSMTFWSWSSFLSRRALWRRDHAR